MSRKLNNVISVGYSLIRFTFLKVFHKGFSFEFVERFSPNVVVEMDKGSRLKFGKKVRVHSGSKLKVRSGAEMIINSGVSLNYNCIFVAKERIEIGAGTEFGPDVKIYDHDHDFRAGLKNGLFKTSPVIIGENCWIGANTVILRGTVLGNNCVVGAGSIIKGNYDDNSIIIQKKETKVESYK